MEDNEIKYKFADTGFDKLKVSAAGLERTATRGAYLKIKGDDFFVTKKQAPEVAVAILRAAGWRGNMMTMLGTRADSFVAAAIDGLDTVVREGEAKKREDLELVQLKVEALGLYNAVHDTTLDYWPSGAYVNRWVEAAKKARVMHRTETGADQP